MIDNISNIQLVEPKAIAFDGFTVYLNWHASERYICLTAT